MTTLIIQLLFFLVVYIVFFGRGGSTYEYSEVSIKRALDRIRAAWDFDELKTVFYQEAHRFPHMQQTLYHAYLKQQRILQGLALEDPWAYNEVRAYIRERMAHCRTPEMVYELRLDLDLLLKRHPTFNDMFTRPHQKAQASTPKKRLFSMCNSIPEVKKRFRKLAFLNHPDRGGSSAAMQEILRQYEEALELQKNR